MFRPANMRSDQGFGWGRHAKLGGIWGRMGEIGRGEAAGISRGEIAGLWTSFFRPVRAERRTSWRPRIASEWHEVPQGRQPNWLFFGVHGTGHSTPLG